ncbi:hypothetical protein [Pseudomonas aeruginosa]|uniref:hypothetical protein n=1 Tax=Pseudomonas aeruginosa TaxID=287 RepID=UPI00129873F1|nr:hypothetical protein [Pseudomonas aeruginosa]MBO2834631.1 hypothetical protein [Pseudomonas aeruginosa]HEC0486948.1 hypothetical protein [Pseudomonas aeruginosa]HEC1420453.1 hypothetical protein [Pseudomonas aeruginosa]
MSTKDYNTAARLPVSLARDPKHRDLVRAYAEQQNLITRHGLLRAIGEAIA